MRAKGADPGKLGGNRGGGIDSGNANNIPPYHEPAQLCPSPPTEAWRRASALAVVLDGTSKPADVAGLGVAWAQCVEAWRQLAPDFPYCVLATNRGRLSSPTTFLARDADALRHAAAVLGARAAPGLLLWANVASVATWTIVAEAVAADMPTEGNA